MNTEKEKQILLERDAEWSKAASKGEDIDHILSFWTDDAVVMPDGFSSVKGKDEIRKYVESSFRIPGFSIKWESSDAEFSPDGNMAYMFSQNEVSMTGEDGSLQAIRGRAVTIWRKEKDGEWRCAVDIWNSEG